MSPSNEDNARQEFLDSSIDVLRREVPESLEWIFAGKLPTVRWNDGSTTDPRLLKGWVAAAAQQTRTTPTKTQRAQAELLHTGDRGKVARRLLKAWIDHDTAESSGLSDARRRELRQMAERAAEVSRKFGRGGTDPDERFQQLLAQEGNTAPASALPFRGLLSLVAACGSSVANELRSDIESYLKAHPDRHEQGELLKELQARLGA